MTISDHTAIMAIRAISAHTRALETEIDEALDTEVPYLEEELLSYSKALMDLKRHYTAVQHGSDNLPSYDSLVEPSDH